MLGKALCGHSQGLGFLCSFAMLDRGLFCLLSKWRFSTQFPFILPLGNMSISCWGRLDWLSEWYLWARWTALISRIVGWGKGQLCHLLLAAGMCCHGYQRQGSRRSRRKIKAVVCVCLGVRVWHVRGCTLLYDSQRKKKGGHFWGALTF